MRDSVIFALPCLVLTVFVLSQVTCAQSAAQRTDFERGLTDFRAGNYKSAAELFERAEKAGPGTTEALLYAGKSFIHVDDFAHAEQALRAYSKFHSNSGDALYLLGFVLHHENRPAESLKIYTQAAAMAAPTGDDLKVVGLDYVLLNDYSDAIYWLKKAVALDPKNHDAWYNLGRSYSTKAILTEAREAFLTVLELNPQDVRAENNLGLILETSGQPDAAIQAYRQAIAWQEGSLHPSEQPYVNLGSLLLEQGHVDEALVALNSAAHLAPGNAYCRLKLGVAYRRAGRLEDSRRELEEATQLEPDNPITHYQLGRVYKDLHALARAQAEFARTAELQRKAAQPEVPPH